MEGTMMVRARTVWLVALLAGAALAACLIAQLHASGEMPLLWKTQPIQQVQPDQQHAYIADLGTDYWDARDRPSVAQVLEEGRPLNSGNILHARIREAGNGLYSFWGTSVLFATSDNSDPRSNGREYVVEVPRSLLSCVRSLFRRDRAA